MKSTKENPINIIETEFEFNAKLGSLISFKLAQEYLDFLKVVFEGKKDDLSKYTLAKVVKAEKELTLLNNSICRELTKGHSQAFKDVVNAQMEEDFTTVTDVLALPQEGKKRIKNLIKKMKKEYGITYA